MMFSLNWLPRLPYLSANSPLVMAEVVTCMMVLLCFRLNGRGILVEKGRLKTEFGFSDGLLAIYWISYGYSFYTTFARCLHWFYRPHSTG